MVYYTFNVGGEQFCVSDGTISSCNPNYLSTVVSRNQDNQVHFIDRDPKLFRYVLLFLRNYSNPLPDSESDLINLKDDALFYGLPPLISMINIRLSELSSQDTISNKPEPVWAKDALLVQYKNGMKDAIERRMELHGENTSEHESEKFIRDHLQMDEFALERDDISSWPTTALKSTIDKLELIGQRFQMATCLKACQGYIFRSLLGTGMMGQESLKMVPLMSTSQLEEMVLKMSKKTIEKYSWAVIAGKQIMNVLEARAEAQRQAWEEMNERFGRAHWPNHNDDNDDANRFPTFAPLLRCRSTTTRVVNMNGEEEILVNVNNTDEEILVNTNNDDAKGEIAGQDAENEKEEGDAIIEEEIADE